MVVDLAASLDSRDPFRHREATSSRIAHARPTPRYLQEEDAPIDASCFGLLVTPKKDPEIYFCASSSRGSLHLVFLAAHSQMRIWHSPFASAKPPSCSSPERRPHEIPSAARPCRDSPP